MNLISELPKTYLKAKLGLIEYELQSLPNYRLGSHGGALVIREYLNVRGRRKQRESLLSSERGKTQYLQYERRQSLMSLKRQLESLLPDCVPEIKLDLSKELPPYGKAFWDDLRLRSDVDHREYSYVHNGIRMCSRTEVLIARVLDALGLKYRYEPLLILGDEVYYPDFIVYLPEFQRCFFIEFLGRLDDRKYALDNGIKIGDYLHNGMIMDKDLLLFCGTQKTMPTTEDIVGAISALIDKLCKVYEVN